MTGMAIVARHALQRAHQRAGDDQAAAAWRAEACAAAARYPQLTFLSTVRTRLSPADASAPGSTAIEALTPRERSVLDYLDSDLTLEAIAERLYVSAHTVKTHTRSIYRKLGVTRRSQAVTAVRRR